MLIDRLKNMVPPLPRVLRARQPAVAAHLTEEHLALVRVDATAEGPRLAGWFVADVPEGAVRTSPVGENILDAEALTPLVEAAREAVAPGGGPLALSVPDAAARIALIPLDAMPRNQKELRDLVAWRMKKSLPFRFDEAVIGSQPFFGRQGTRRLLAVAMRRRILAEHEELFRTSGFDVGSVSIDSLALAEQIPSSMEDRLLLTVGAGWFSLFVLGPAEPIFHRSKLLPASERTGAARDAFVASEISPTLEYHRTRLGGDTLEQAWVHVEGVGEEALRETIAAGGQLRADALPLLVPDDIDPAAACRLGPALALAARSVAGTVTAPADERDLKESA